MQQFVELVPAITSRRFGIGQQQLELIALSRCCKSKLGDQAGAPWGYECSYCGFEESPIDYSSETYLSASVSLECSNETLTRWAAGWLELEESLVCITVQSTSTS